VKIVLSITKAENWEILDYLSFESKINYLKNFSQGKLDELNKSFQKDKTNSYVDRISLRILDNLQINISNIHIRIEDNYMNPNLSLGLTLQSLNVTNTDKNWHPIFVDRNLNKESNIYKLLELNNFGVFFNLNDNLNLGEYSNYKEVESIMEDLFSDTKEYVKDYDYLIKPSKIILYLFSNFSFFIK